MRKEKNPEKKSRAKYKLTSELAEIITITNLVSPNINLLSHREVIDKVEKDYLLRYGANRKSDLDKKVYIDMWFEILDECFKDFLDQEYKKRIFSYWFERTNESLSELEKTEVALFWSVLDTYEFIRKTRKDVKAIIKYVKELNEKSPILYLYKTDLYAPLSFTQNNGETRANLQGLSKVIEHIDLERLRNCSICDFVFWAENKNSFACSESCRNALRQRRHRAKNKEEINFKRRENYKQKMKVNQLKEKKNNGTL